MDAENVTKSSFPPISDLESEILILGTFPGEKSLQMQEYYRDKK
jgi:G:T/U-mismatch repair DNA glycosylase